jgi:hypothetical protein
MAVTEAFAGSSSIGTTEFDLPSGSTSLGAQTTAGVYQLFLDCNAVAAGDRFEVYLYEKVQSSSTQRKCETWTIAGVQANPDWVGPSVMLINGWTMSVKKISGTDRTIGYSIRKA